MDTPPVDLHHLRRYTLGDPALEAEILALFAADLPTRLSAMRTAATEKDWKMATHTLKGAGRAVGAWQVAERAEAAERLGGPSNTNACRMAIQSVEVAAGDALCFLRSLGVEVPAQVQPAA